MHSYLKSIGFEGLDREQLKIVLEDVKKNPNYQSIVGPSGSDKAIEFRREYGQTSGIAVVGSLDFEDNYEMDYYYPYLEGREISTVEDVEIVKNSDKDSYQGIVDDPKLGIDLVFFIIDEIGLIQDDAALEEYVNHGGVRLSGLCENGSILLPLDASIRPVESYETVANRANLMRAAKSGDHDAIEELSIQDLDQYTELGERIEREDMLTILSTYIMPQGIESDKYTILGDIEMCSTEFNRATGQLIHILKLRVNGMPIDVAISDKDLVGEPMEGRRFRGDIWLQGRIS